MRRLQWLALMLLVAPACVSSQPSQDADPRLGDFGRVRFAGGGGCNSSTTLAVGSRETLTLEPVSEPLPTDLSASSTDDSIIDVAGLEEGLDIELTAHTEGESYVELLSAGDVWDGLRFNAEHATSAEWTAPESVLAGGLFILHVSELFGSCGEECPLLGGDFIEWDTRDAEGFEENTDRDRIATFIAGNVLGHHIIDGLEPETRAVLVSHDVTVVAPSEVGEPVAEIIVMLPDQTILEPQTLPVSVPRGSLLQLRVGVESEDGLEIPLTTHEATWVIEDGATSLDSVEDDDPHFEGPVFTAAELGDVSIRLTIALLDHESEQRLTIIE